MSSVPELPATQIVAEVDVASPDQPVKMNPLIVGAVTCTDWFEPAPATAVNVVLLTAALSPGAPVAVAVNVDANNEGSWNEAVNEPSEATVALPSYVHELGPVSETCTVTDSPGVKPVPVRTTVSPET